MPHTSPGGGVTLRGALGQGTAGMDGTNVDGLVVSKYIFNE